MPKFLSTVFFFLLSHLVMGQGLITGNVMDDKKKPLEGASVQLRPFLDSLPSRTVLTTADGAFIMEHIPFGLYRLRISFVGLQSLTLDSLHFRTERSDFNLNDLILKPGDSASKMEEIIIYSEKPLVESKDGNVTFNAGESALSAGSNASDLLTNVPLVTKDPTGKILVRGKEPKILIDDKPVELNLQQLQDLLESMPGSSVEKIEVMTNPPPQYASEQGGVINIVTKKGRVGMNGRITAYGGSRGEAGLNGNFNYRRQGFVLNVNAGGAYNRFQGESYSIRRNIYSDSVNFFNTSSGNSNKNLRPSLRLNADYDINKRNSLNLTFNFNANDYNNHNLSAYRNINRFEELYRLNNRLIENDGNSENFNASTSYTHKTKKAGETIRLIGSFSRSWNQSSRHYFQVREAGDKNKEATQQQENANQTKGVNLRVSYDLPLKNRKTFLSFGSYFTASRSDVDNDGFLFRTSDSSWRMVDALTNAFRFHQQVSNVRGSLKQVFGEGFSATAGLAVEQTKIHFDLFKTASDTGNVYWSVLPFATFNRNWKDKINLTLSYRRTVRRPGMGELNPTIDSVPYLRRFGNPGLIASLADNFDLVIGKTSTKFYANISFGYNVVDDIYSQVRIQTSDTTTDVTWQNISGRKEYEMSTWSGYTLSKKMRINFSASYTYNAYGRFDKEERKFRNGGSFTSNLNAHYNLKDLYTATSSLSFNRFANPQGTVRSNISMNLGFQARLLKKKMMLTLNVIDPFVQQQNRSFTYGLNWIQENFSTTNTRNFRLTASYTLTKTVKKAGRVKA